MPDTTTPACIDLDQHLDAVLRAAGSALHNYTMAKSLSDMRAALRAYGDARAAAAISSAPQATACRYPDCKCPTESPCLQGLPQPAQASDARDAACIWALADDDTGAWQSACGGDPWVFGADDPTKNGMRYCIHCGKRMVQADAAIKAAEGENRD